MKHTALRRSQYGWNLAGQRCSAAGILRVGHGNRIQQRSRIRVARSIEKSGIVRKFDHRAHVHDQYPVADSPDNGQVVRDENYRQTAVLLRLSQHAQNLFPHGAVESSNGFVTNEHLWLQY